MPTTIDNNKTWWWNLQILALFPFSVLYSQLNGIHSKHMLVIKWNTQLWWHVHRSSENHLYVYNVYSILCIQTWCSDALKWTYITINVWQIQKTGIWLSITWNPFYLTKGKNGWHITGMFGDDVLALKTKSNNLHQLETCYTGLQSISIYCCTCQL